MRKMFAILYLALAGLGAPVLASNQGKMVWIPITETDSKTPIQLEATLYLPPGDGRFPVVIYNHGSTGGGMIAESYTERPMELGKYLNRKGIALLAPMRRGRGKSDGRYGEPYGCSKRGIRNGIAYASKSLDAAIQYLEGEAWADTTRIVLSGQSRGGMLSVVYAAEHPGRFLGVINFSGGWVGDGCKPLFPKDMNQVLFAEAGERSKAPHLFLYGASDSYYSDASIEGFAEAFAKSGGELTFKLFPIADGADGHGLFYYYSRLWMPLTDELLKRMEK